MLFTPNLPIWLYPLPIDFRKQLDGLILLVSDHLKMNPTSGQMFLFRDKSAKKIKLLWWDSNGFWMFYKRLEQGKLKFPKEKNSTLALTRDQFNWLLSGLDYTQHVALPEVTATNFY